MGEGATILRLQHFTKSFENSHRKRDRLHVGDNSRQQRHGATRWLHTVRHKVAEHESDKSAENQTGELQWTESSSGPSRLRAGQIPGNTPTPTTATASNGNRAGSRHRPRQPG